MNPNLIASAVLFSPAAIAGAAVGVAALRQHPYHRAVRAVLAESAARNTAAAAAPDGPPPDGGQPTPVPDTEPLAQVIPLHRHAA